MSFSPPPITARERPHLEAMGARFAELRSEAGLTQRALAQSIGISPGQISAIERARSRTRRSTLAQLMRGLDPARAAELTEELVALAGPGLARESKITGQLAELARDIEELGPEEARRRHEDRIGLTSLRAKLARIRPTPSLVADPER